MWYINEAFKGDVVAFLRQAQAEGLPFLISSYPRPGWTGLTYIVIFGVIEALFQLYLPGKMYNGPVTPMGNVPVYKVRTQ